MSAAIEGIQTCFHKGHMSTNDHKSIIECNPITFPTILVGFAFIGALMQWVTRYAHLMCEEELRTESWLVLNSKLSNENLSANSKCDQVLKQLDINELARDQSEHAKSDSPYGSNQRVGYLANSCALYTKTPQVCLMRNQTHLYLYPSTVKNESRHEFKSKFSSKFLPSLKSHRSLDVLPHNFAENNYVSLTSLRYNQQEVGQTRPCRQLTSKTPEQSDTANHILSDITPSSHTNCSSNYNQNVLPRIESAPFDDKWRPVKDLASPVALLLGAFIIYSSSDGKFYVGCYIQILFYIIQALIHVSLYHQNS